MYKIKYNFAKTCLKDLFSAVSGNYNLRSQSNFGGPGINTVFFGANSIRYFESVIWNSLPNDLRNNSDFDLLKTIIRKWKSIGCSSRLCKNYIDGLSFITASAQSQETDSLETRAV